MVPSSGPLILHPSEPTVKQVQTINKTGTHTSEPFQEGRGPNWGLIGQPLDKKPTVHDEPEHGIRSHDLAMIIGLQIDLTRKVQIHSLQGIRAQKPYLLWVWGYNSFTMMYLDPLELRVLACGSSCKRLLSFSAVCRAIMF